MTSKRGHDPPPGGGVKRADFASGSGQDQNFIKMDAWPQEPSRMLSSDSSKSACEFLKNVVKMCISAIWGGPLKMTEITRAAST